MSVAIPPEVLPSGAGTRLQVRRLDLEPDPERAFAALYRDSRYAFWLDSSAASRERGRFSFMGDAQGPASAVLRYDVAAGELWIERQGGSERRRESIFAFLERELSGLAAADPGLPFGFDCGLVGYLGYELKADCGAEAGHRATTPDAALILADRLLAFDHLRRHTYLLSLVAEGCEDAGERWLSAAEARLRSLPELGEPELAPASANPRLLRSRRRYEDDIAACRRYLFAGHSYEICLTNKLVGESRSDPFELYRSLRRVNPAPFAAFLRFADLTVLSSSPERFLAVDGDGRAEARPIKGTSRRGGSPAEDARLALALRTEEKSRAENVTIVDLLRNDLGRVCEVGTIEVPELMEVESYETVHQLVSSVRGRLREGVGCVEAVRACFPPGSMTGAPKLRTMEILEELEGGARGVYSGAIGYFGRSGGCDLSVAIRTIVLEGGSMSIGAGGAIVVESEPQGELEEMLLKGRTAVAATGPIPAPASVLAH